MTEREKFNVETYFTILDRLKSEVENRCATYNNIFGKYGFLINLSNLSSEEITKKSNKLQKFYSDNLEKSFSFECLRFKSYLQNNAVKSENNFEFVELSRSQNLQTVVPNVDIALRMSLTYAWQLLTVLPNEQ